MKKVLWGCVCAAAWAGSLWAQGAVWQPSAGLTQRPVWPGAAPNPQPVAGPEVVESSGKELVAGKPYLSIRNVTRPTWTVYPPQGRNTGAAVVVLPGGGYQILAIDLEGTEACDWLVARGITCILLKYRVTEVGPYPASGAYPESPMALEDAQRTMGLVRSQAAALHIDPHRIGVLGFSAGGHLAAALSVHYDRRSYPPVDAADAVSCRPDFAILLYLGHLNLAAAEWDAKRGTRPYPLRVPAHADRQLALNPDLHVTAGTPPTFLLQNEDDHEDSVYDALAWFIALQKAGVPAELHVYAQGGHAFGLRRTRFAVTAWPQLLAAWLHGLGVLPT